MSTFKARGSFGGRTFVAGAGIGVVAAAVFFLFGSGPRSAAGPAIFSSHPALAYASTTSGFPSVANIAERALPSVVNIASTQTVKQSPYAQDPFFREFFRHFGPGRPTPRQKRGLGSGVIVSSDGLVVTNNHVVAKADKIKVVLSNKREYSAKVVGTDPKSDLAVIKLKGAKGLKPLPLGNSEKLRLGDVVLAIGNPFGLSQTVTMGIVSAKGRANMGIVDYEDFIQTDAAINPGNSGGALVNMRGELVGINTAILSRSGGYQGIGFAIPTNMVKPIMSSLLKQGKVVRGWLGVVIQEVNRELAKAMSLPTHRGVLIADVDPRGPARKVGLKRGDLLVKINGRQVDSTAKLRNLIAAAGAGGKISLEFYRGGRLQSKRIKLAELPSKLGAVSHAAPNKSGLSVAPLDPQSRRQYNISRRVKQGVVIQQVDPRGPAATSGLQRGDVILEVNRVTIRNTAQFYQQYSNARGRVLLLVYRRGATMYMLIQK